LGPIVDASSASAEPTRYQVYVSTNLDRLPAGTKASSAFTYDSNCVKTAFAESFITNPGSSPFEACAYEKTWADYTITIETPTKQVASRRVRLQQTSSPNIYATTFEGQCQGGSVGCSGNSQTAQAAGSHALTITFTLGPLPTAPAGYTFCASEGLVCSVTGTKEILYGADGKYRNKMGATGAVKCDSGNFGGDPAYGVYKNCFSKD
ncbi:MAG TPA: hypothetical protein VHU17_13845, partial [Acidimicrobiales bacterium]|nr:hypothetical protein [Acidimicrobiales bacterium]